MVGDSFNLIAPSSMRKQNSETRTRTFVSPRALSCQTISVCMTSERSQPGSKRNLCYTNRNHRERCVNGQVDLLRWGESERVMKGRKSWGKNEVGRMKRGSEKCDRSKHSRWYTDSEYRGAASVDSWGGASSPALPTSSSPPSAILKSASIERLLTEMPLNSPDLLVPPHSLVNSHLMLRSPSRERYIYSYRIS